MNNQNIKFVRSYLFYNRLRIDVIYNSCRVFTYTPETLPETVKRFMASAPKIHTHYDKVYNRDETIYEF